MRYSISPNIILKSSVSAFADCPVVLFLPCAEWNKNFPVLVKRHISMHHSAKTDGADISKYHIVFFFHIFAIFSLAIAKTCPNIVQCIGPDSIIQTIFPFTITGSDRMMFFIDQNRFNSCRTKFQSKNCFCRFPITSLIRSLFSIMFSFLSAICNTVPHQFIFKPTDQLYPYQYKLPRFPLASAQSPICSAVRSKKMQCDVRLLQESMPLRLSERSGCGVQNAVATGSFGIGFSTFLHLHIINNQTEAVTQINETLPLQDRSWR